MSTASAPNLSQVPYDPDEAPPTDSPILEPYRPSLRPSPSPAPTLSSPVSPPPSPGNKRSSRRRKGKHVQGDAILIGHLDGHRRDIAAYAEIEPLASEDTEDTDLPDGSDCSGSPRVQWFGGGKSRGGPSKTREPASRRMSSGSPDRDDMGVFDLKSLAADALAAVTGPKPDAGPTPPITDNDVMGGRTYTAAPSVPVASGARRADPARDERRAAAAMPSPYSPPSLYSPREAGATPLSFSVDPKSPTANGPPSRHSEGLPPIKLNSPRFDANGQTLPSIRSQLGDLHQLGNHHAAENEGLRRPSFPGSPPGTVPRLPSLHSHHASPPVQPADRYQNPLSPNHALASPRYYLPPANGIHRPPEYTRSPTESSGPDQSIPTPAASVTDRMSIDGITNHNTPAYVCRFPGCNAPPFQTQYLLNSHANVHSSARPHYCPVPGCPRSEGGKGFKRKNEMIRHGLVHDSPGYVCPFCPDREHKYPRPDNLQR